VTTVVPSHSASNSVTPLPTNHHLIGKITIPIGTIIGIATAGGVTYYIINRTTLNNILKSINNSLTLDQINAKINKLDQYRNAGRNIFKKII
jgi:hypothetical protein